MVEIRTVRPEDLDALCHIALATGDSGADAAATYQNKRLLSQIYAAPYAVLCPETVFVITDRGGIGGYIVGAADTRAFEAMAETAWWPKLRAACPDPPETDRPRWTPDQRRMHTIHHPRMAPQEIVVAYPSHLHINLLPALRGRGLGRMLMDRWLRAVRALGSQGAHLAVGAANLQAIRFYAACGFRELPDIPQLAPGAIWFGIKLTTG